MKVRLVCFWFDLITFGFTVRLLYIYVLDRVSLLFVIVVESLYVFTVLSNVILNKYNQTKEKYISDYSLASRRRDKKKVAIFEIVVLATNLTDFDDFFFTR